MIVLCSFSLIYYLNTLTRAIVEDLSQIIEFMGITKFYEAY